MTRVWAKAAALAVLIGTALVASLSAVAAEEKAIPSDRQAKWLARYPEMDADGDGTLTREEVRQFLRAKRARDRTGAPGTAQPNAPAAKGGPGRRFGPEAAAKILERHPEADADGDGTLSPQERKAFFQSRDREWRTRLLSEHPELDTNGDGTLSEEEFKAGKATIGEHARMAMAQRILQDHPEADVDGDGTLSQEEFMSFRRSFGSFGPALRAGPGRFFDWLIEHFAQADLDGSGELSKEELVKLKAKYAGPDRGMGPFGMGIGPFGPRSSPPGPIRERLFQKFPEADTNGDGQLSDEELKTLKERHRGEGRGRGERGRHRKEKGSAADKKPSQ